MGYLRLVLEYFEFADPIEGVEVAEDGAEDGIDEREASAVEIRTVARPALDLAELAGERLDLRREGALVGAP